VIAFITLIGLAWLVIWTALDERRNPSRLLRD
jgi:hypothetical protein